MSTSHEQSGSPDAADNGANGTDVVDLRDGSPSPEAAPTGAAGNITEHAPAAGPRWGKDSSDEQGKATRPRWGHRQRSVKRRG